MELILQDDERHDVGWLIYAARNSNFRVAQIRALDLRSTLIRGDDVSAGDNRRTCAGETSHCQGKYLIAFIEKKAIMSLTSCYIST